MIEELWATWAPLTCDKVHPGISAHTWQSFKAETHLHSGHIALE